MVNLYNATDRALGLMNQGHFDQVYLKIETSGTHKKYIFVAKNELPYGTTLYSLFQRGMSWIKGPTIEWKEGTDVRPYFEEGKAFHAKLTRALEKAKYLGQGIKKMERSGYQGRIMDRAYWCESIESSHLSKGVYPSLKRKYEEQQPGIDFDSWLRSDAGLNALEQVQGTRDITESQVVQMGAEDRQLYRVEVRNVSGEIILYYQGAPLDTKALCGSQTLRMMTADGASEIEVGGKAIFVIGPDGNIYVGKHDIGKFHHSSFLAGRPVICAGEIVTDHEGRVLTITDKSGHYKPREKNVMDGLTVFRRKGVDLSGVTLVRTPIEGYRGGRYNALDFLQQEGGSTRQPLQIQDTI